MTTVSTQLDEALQALIDARLDTIDRMLLGRQPRADRLAIVREVESQIFDLITEHDPDRLGRDEVLAVLGRLDPPEAYLPEEPTAGLDAGRPGPVLRPEVGMAPRASRARLSLAGGILGVCTASSIPVLGLLTWFVTMEINSIVLFVLGFVLIALLGLSCGIASIVLAVRSGLRTGWSTVGLVSGIIALVFTAAVNLVLVLLLLL